MKTRVCAAVLLFVTLAPCVVLSGLDMAPRARPDSRAMELLILLRLMAPPAQAQSLCPGFLQTELELIGEETIPVSTAAVGLTVAIYADAVQAAVSVKLASINTTISGVDPTVGASGSGMPWVAGDHFHLCGQKQLKNLRAIRQSVDAQLFAQYWRIAR